MSRVSRCSFPVLLAAIGGLLGFALPALADPPARVGRLSEISGTVSFHDSADEQWSPATLNYPVTSGNSFWTEPGARAEIHVGSTAIHLDGTTELDITALDDQRFDATLPQGTINIRVPRFNNGDGYNIATPRGTVTLASPGTYRISAGTDRDPTRVAVLEGAARVVEPNSSVALSRGEEALLTGTDRIDYQIVEAQPTPFDNASLARERREEERARTATRYVSPEMTGYEDLDDHGTWQTEPSYGAVWYPRAVPADWAPYRYGHWRWVDPWGWTWIDDQPWGFAPFHYGRWAFVGDRWGWTPGIVVARPVYAPALVAFVGGGGWSLSLSFGSEPAVGWFPLAPQEVFVPSFPASVAFVRNVNITNVTNVTNITNQTINNPAPAVVANVRHANQQFATVVPQSAFVSAHPVAKAALTVPHDAIAKAPVTAGVPITPAAAAASGRQEAVTRATRVAEAQGEPIKGPPPQAAAKAATAPATPAPGPAIAAKGKPQPGQPQQAQTQPGRVQPSQPQAGKPQPGQPQQAQTQPGRAQPSQPQAGQPQPGQPQIAQPQVAQPQVAQPQPGQPQPGPGQSQAAKPPERGAPVWSQNRPPVTAAAPGPPIPPRSGTTAQGATAAPPASPGTQSTGAPALAPRAPANETAQGRPGAPQPQAAAPGPAIPPRSGTTAQGAPATPLPTPGTQPAGAPALAPSAPANETAQGRPGAPQPQVAAPGPPIQRAAPSPAPQTGQARTAGPQSAAPAAPPIARAPVEQTTRPPAPPAARAPVEPPAHAAAPSAAQRPAAAPTPSPAHPAVAARAPAPPPEHSVQRPVQQTVLQPTHQGWVRSSPPPQEAARPAPAKPAAAAPAPAQPQQKGKSIPPNPQDPKHVNG